jgi:methylglyoxal synthase
MSSDKDEFEDNSRHINDDLIRAPQVRVEEAIWNNEDNDIVEKKPKGAFSLKNKSKIAISLCCCLRKTRITNDDNNDGNNNNHDSSIIDVRSIQKLNDNEGDVIQISRSHKSRVSFDDSHYNHVSMEMNDEKILEEVMKLRVALVEKWIDYKKLKLLFDVDRDGVITYDDFYDVISQFGFHTAVNLKFVFRHVDRNNLGVADLEDVLRILKVKEHEIKPDRESIELELAPFPETLLVALVAHNNMKPSMMKFVSENLLFFKRVKLVTTGSTGRSLTALGLKVHQLVSSGPLGGDQEIGGMISKGEVGAVFFFQDPLSSHPHKADIQALNRICCVHDTMFASNPSTAQALVYSLEYSAYGYSHLMGMNPKQAEDSTIVQDYKSNQQKVIANVAGVGRRGSEKSSIRRFSLLSRGSDSQQNRGSIIRAPASIGR